MILRFEGVNRKHVSVMVSQIESIVPRDETSSFPGGSTVTAVSGKTYASIESEEVLITRLECLNLEKEIGKLEAINDRLDERIDVLETRVEGYFEEQDYTG